MIPFDNLVGAYRKYIQDAADFSRNTEIELWQRIASYYAACGASYVTARENDVAAIKALDGGKFDEESGTTFRYPFEVTEAVRAFQKKLSENKAVLVSGRTLLAGGENVDAYALPLQSVYISITKLDSLAPDVAAIGASALEQVKAAQRAKNEADLRYDQAQKALAANDFDEARRRLQDSRTKDKESLSYK